MSREYQYPHSYRSYSDYRADERDGWRRYDRGSGQYAGSRRPASSWDRERGRQDYRDAPAAYSSADSYRFSTDRERYERGRSYAPGTVAKQRMNQKYSQTAAKAVPHVRERERDNSPPRPNPSKNASKQAKEKAKKAVVYKTPPGMSKKAAKKMRRRMRDAAAAEEKAQALALAHTAKHSADEKIYQKPRTGDEKSLVKAEVRAKAEREERKPAKAAASNTTKPVKKAPANVQKVEKKTPPEKKRVVEKKAVAAGKPEAGAPRKQKDKKAEKEATRAEKSLKKDSEAVRPQKGNQQDPAKEEGAGKVGPSRPAGLPVSTSTSRASTDVPEEDSRQKRPLTPRTPPGSPSRAASLPPLVVTASLGKERRAQLRTSSPSKEAKSSGSSSPGKLTVDLETRLRQELASMKKTTSPATAASLPFTQDGHHKSRTNGEGECQRPKAAGAIALPGGMREAAAAGADAKALERARQVEKMISELNQHQEKGQGSVPASKEPGKAQASAAPATTTAADSHPQPVAASSPKAGQAVDTLPSGSSRKAAGQPAAGSGLPAKQATGPSDLRATWAPSAGNATTSAGPANIEAAKAVISSLASLSPADLDGLRGPVDPRTRTTRPAPHISYVAPTQPAQPAPPIYSLAHATSREVAARTHRPPDDLSTSQPRRWADETTGGYRTASRAIAEPPYQRGASMKYSQTAPSGSLSQAKATNLRSVARPSSRYDRAGASGRYGQASSTSRYDYGRHCPAYPNPAYAQSRADFSGWLQHGGQQHQTARATSGGQARNSSRALQAFANSSTRGEDRESALRNSAHNALSLASKSASRATSSSDGPSKMLAEQPAAPLAKPTPKPAEKLADQTKPTTRGQSEAAADGSGGISTENGPTDAAGGTVTANVADKGVGGIKSSAAVPSDARQSPGHALSTAASTSASPSSSASSGGSSLPQKRPRDESHQAGHPPAKKARQSESTEPSSGEERADEGITGGEGGEGGEGGDSPPRKKVEEDLEAVRAKLTARGHAIVESYSHDPPKRWEKIEDNDWSMSVPLALMPDVSRKREEEQRQRCEAGRSPVILSRLPNVHILLQVGPEYDRKVLESYLEKYFVFISVTIAAMREARQQETWASVEAKRQWLVTFSEKAKLSLWYMLRIDWLEYYVMYMFWRGFEARTIRHAVIYHYVCVKQLAKHLDPPASAPLQPAELLLPLAKLCVSRLVDIHARLKA